MNHILKKLSVLAKTDIRYLLHGSTYLSIGQVFAALSGLILTIFLVRWLDQAEYGQYTYILSIAGIVATFTLTGMDTAVAQAVAKGFEKTLIDGFKEKFSWSIPVAVLTLTAALYYLHQGNGTLGYSLIAIALCAPFIYASSLYGSYFNGKKEFKNLAIDNAVKNILITISVLAVAYYTKNIIYIVLAFLLSNTLISLLRFFLLIKKKDIDSSESDKKSLSLGKHLSGIELLGNITTHIDKLIVFQLLGATQLAFYAIALAPIKQLQSISRIIRGLVLPKFSTRTARELKETMRHKSMIFFFVCLLIVTSYCILVEYVFVYIFPDYEEAIPFTQALAFVLLFMPSTLPVQALTALHEEKSLYLAHLAKSLTKIGGLLILIPLYGIWGAIIAYIVTQVVTTFFLYSAFQKVTAAE